MPRGEKNDIATGQAYGQRARQQEFKQATKPAQPAPEPTAAAPTGAGVPAGTGVDSFMNELLDAATGPTNRPEEPVTMGLDEFEDEVRQELGEWLPVLRELAIRPGASQYVRDLALRAGAFLEG